MSAPEIAVKVTSTLPAKKHHSWLQRTCGAIAVPVMPPPQISVKASPQQQGERIKNFISLWHKELRFC
jgi:hypothetical protein